MGEAKRRPHAHRLGRRADLRGAKGLSEPSFLVVAADASGPVEDGVGAVGIEMDLDPRLDEVRPHRTFPDLEAADQIGNQGVNFGRRPSASWSGPLGADRGGLNI